MSAPDLRPATTVLLLREGQRGVEVFLVKRHGKSRFMPGAWVFPGGRVDDDDHTMPQNMVSGGEMTASRLGLSDDEATGFLVAGVRETFEEAGIWLGKGELPEALRHPLNSGEVRFCDLLAAHQASIDLDVLKPWGWWVTPVSEPRRYDTRF
ncbi:MAG: 8-oxo-dGTP pyrophosphatase MutT (NUDIX family), partial [Myxococcota bacterium]